MCLTTETTPISLRVVETDEEKALAMYEVGVNPDSPELLQINSDQRLFVALDTGLDVLKRHDTKIKAVPELRSIRVPALNIEALWLHYDGATEDQFKLIRSFETPGFDSNRVYGETEFITMIISGSAAVKEMDDEMGA